MTYKDIVTKIPGIYEESKDMQLIFRNNKSMDLFSIWEENGEVFTKEHKSRKHYEKK